MEGIAKHYFEKLDDDKNPALLLTKMYCELFGIPFQQFLIPLLSKLVKVYGRKAVFISILDIAGNENIDHKKVYGLLNYICNKQLLNDMDSQPRSLVSDVSARLEKIEKAKKTNIVVRSPFDE